jgi:hypothetical protein
MCLCYRAADSSDWSASASPYDQLKVRADKVVMRDAAGALLAHFLGYKRNA